MILSKYNIITLSLFIVGFCAIADPQKGKKEQKPGWVENFENQVKVKNEILPRGWQVKNKMGTPSAKFNIVKGKNNRNILKIESDKGSGTLIDENRLINLKQYPIVKWEWKAIELPKGADGRYSEKDDQVIGIYIGAGGYFSQKSIAYRWETETPIGAEGKTAYCTGILQVKWFCLRSKKDELGKWYIEERNAAEDFKKAYGYIPEKCAVSIVTNSQYTGTRSVAELGRIEFLPEKEKK